MFILIFCLFNDCLDKPMQVMARELITRIDSGRVIVQNFTNMNGEERLLGVYLATRMSNYLLEEAKKNKRIEVRDRQGGKKVTLEEIQYRPSMTVAEYNKSLQADIAVTGSYALRPNALEIMELKAITTPGATIKSQAKSKIIPLKPEDYEVLNKYETEKLPIHISCDDLFFLCDAGGGKFINNITILDKYKKPWSLDSLFVGEYIKVKIDLDTANIFLYVLGWHQGEKEGQDIVTVLYPNEFDPPNPTRNRIVIIPADDENAFTAEEPPGYNWIRVIASVEPISELALKGYFEPTATQIKGFNNALKKLDKTKWQGKYVDLWIVKKGKN